MSIATFSILMQAVLAEQNLRRTANSSDLQDSAASFIDHTESNELSGIRCRLAHLTIQGK